MRELAQIAELHGMAVVAHGDDREAHLHGLMNRFGRQSVVTATDGERSSLNYSGRCLCRP